MIIAEYEARFHILPKYFITNNSIEFEKIQKFVKRLNAMFQLATTRW